MHERSLALIVCRLYRYPMLKTFCRSLCSAESFFATAYESLAAARTPRYFVCRQSRSPTPRHSNIKIKKSRLSACHPKSRHVPHGPCSKSWIIYCVLRIVPKSLTRWPNPSKKPSSDFSFISKKESRRGPPNQH